MPTATEIAAAPPGDRRTIAVAAVPGLFAPEPSRSRVTLGTRLFLFAALLIGATLGLVVGLLAWFAGREAERTIANQLETVPEIHQGYTATQEASRRTQVRSLAEAVGTKALLGSGADLATLRDSAAEFGMGLGAATVFLFDSSGALQVRSDRVPGEEAGRDFSGVSWVREPLDSGSPAAAYILELRHERRLSLVAAAPVIQGEGAESRTLGVVAAAWPVSREQADDLARLLAGDVLFLGNVAPRNQAPELGALVASASLGNAAVLEALAAENGFVDALFARGERFGPFEFSVFEDPYLATALPIRSGAGEPIAALVVARSKRIQMAPFRRLRGGVVSVGVAGLLLSLPLSFVVARRVSRPIEVLARGAEEVRQGKLDIELPVRGRDEVGRLAHAFGAMVQEMREKRELEKLVTRLRNAASRRSSGDALVVLPDGLPRPGQILADRYQVLNVLGEGGMGSVLRVRDQELDEVVALKVLSAPASEERTRGEQQLRQEIKLARAITHPNVVRVHDLGESDGMQFLTMEFVAGTTLRQLLDEKHEIDLAAGLQISKQICRGLQAVHEAGIVHGDLKPENVMVTPNGVVRLMDFGVARAAHSRAEVRGMSLGTPCYMSPEQARGGTIDAMSDVYGLGVLMFELFSGRLPFTDVDSRTVMERHVREQAPDVRAARPELPATLAEILGRCLQKDRAARPTSASDVERALARVQGPDGDRAPSGERL